MVSERCRRGRLALGEQRPQLGVGRLGHRLQVDQALLALGRQVDAHDAAVARCRGSG